MAKFETDFQNYILAYCKDCKWDESFFCRLSCPVYKTYIFLNTHKWEDPEELCNIKLTELKCSEEVK